MINHVVDFLRGDLGFDRISFAYQDYFQKGDDQPTYSFNAAEKVANCFYYARNAVSFLSFGLAALFIRVNSTALSILGTVSAALFTVPLSPLILLTWGLAKLCDKIGESIGTDRITRDVRDEHYHNLKETIRNLQYEGIFRFPFKGDPCQGMYIELAQILTTQPKSDAEIQRMETIRAKRGEAVCAVLREQAQRIRDSNASQINDRLVPAVKEYNQSLPPPAPTPSYLLSKLDQN